MIGIIALFFLFILFVVVHSIANRFANDFSSDDNPKLRKRLYRIALGFIIFVLVGDEIIGGTQLAYFCSTEPKIQVLVDELQGRTVQGQMSTFVKEYTPLQIKKHVTKIFDIDSKELVAKKYWYVAEGGWLARTIAFNDSKKPLFAKHSCSNSKEFEQLLIINNMNYLREIWNQSWNPI